MSTGLMILSGVMPFSSLKSTCLARRRLVSEMAACIESVILSAYRTALPCRWRAARPIVWISEPAERRKSFLIGVENRHQRHLGQVEPFAQQVDADQHIEFAPAAGPGES